MFVASHKRPRRLPIIGWVALAAGLLILIMLGLAITPRHNLEGLLGSRAALAIDLLVKAAERDQKRATCVVVGDSRAAAFGTWPSDCNVENVALYGSTTFIWRDLLPLLDVTIPADAKVAVWLGVNDLRYDPRADSEVTAHNLIELIRTLAAYRRHVWVLPQIPVHFDTPDRQARFLETILHIEQRLRTEFRGNGQVTFVDAAAVVGTLEQPNRKAYFDEVHLTEAASIAVRKRLDEAWRLP